MSNENGLIKAPRFNHKAKCEAWLLDGENRQHARTENFSRPMCPRGGIVEISFAEISFAGQATAIIP